MSKSIKKHYLPLGVVVPGAGATDMFWLAVSEAKEVAGLAVEDREIGAPVAKKDEGKFAKVFELAWLTADVM